MGASDEEDHVHVEQPRDPVRVDAQMRRTTVSSATIGVTRGPAAWYPEGLCRRFAWDKECHVKKILELTEHTTTWSLGRRHGESVGPKAVRQARLKEMKYVKEKEVWQPISQDEARRRGWKVVKTRWIDINKGDEDMPNYLSLLAAKEFNDGAGEAIRQHGAAGGVEVPDQ